MDMTHEPEADPQLGSPELGDADPLTGEELAPELESDDEAKEDAPPEVEVASGEEQPSSVAVAAARAEELVARLDRVEDRLGEGFDRLLGELKSQWALDRFREEQVDTLHAELQEYKQDLLGRTVQPVLQGIIRLHGDLAKTVEALQAKAPEELTPERFFRVLDGFHEDLELLLERHGVSRFGNPGEVFEPARQTALRTEPAPRADLAGRILARIRPGFEQGNVLLRKEGVAVWAAPLDSPSEATAESTTETDSSGKAPDEPSPDDMEEPK